MKKTIITCMLSMLCIYAAAQHHEHFTGCGHDHLHSTKMDSDASYRAKHEAFEKLMQDRITSTPSNQAKAAPPIYTLPVVFHIIHNNGPENISNARVQQALQDLNDAFSNVGYYDPATGVDVQIAFCLARQTPNGGPTTGINRIVSPFTNFNMDTDDITVKNLSRWDPLRYINVWIVNEITSFQGSGVVGYAYLPSAHGQLYDGIVMEAGYTGSSPVNSSVLVHEMGHYLGLYHTFQGGCTNNNCLVDGDRVCDTPPDANTAYITCGSSMNTCNTDDDDLRPINPFRPIAQGGLGDQPDMHINYMDYSLVSCYSAFSQGQKDRMQLVVTNIRNSLLASSGCNTPCPAPIIPAFTIAPNPASVGQTVNFTNTGGASASYRWNINNVQFATTRNAARTFSNVGTYRVSLIVDAGGVCQDSSVQFVNVNCNINASFTASNSTATLGVETVNFVNTTAGAVRHIWFLNTVQVSTAQNYSCVFNRPGPNEVCLVSIGNGCSDTVCMTINVIAPINAENCADGIDNDGDGQIDLFDADCVITPTCRIDNGSSFGITTSWESTANDLTATCSPIVGDINNDEMPEIIVPLSNPSGNSPGLRIYNGDGSDFNKTTIDILLPLASSWSVALSNAAIADFDRNGFGEIVAVGADGYVYIFSHLGGNASTGNYLRKSNQTTRFTFGSPKIADINQDGTPEIVVGTDVFKLGLGNILTKVITGPSFMPIGREAVGWGADIALVDILSSADCGNGDCEGLEIVAGSKVYSPNLTTGTLNVVRDLSTISGLCPSNEDGPTAVADMNLDGTLDVVFSGPHDVYIWSPKTNALLLKVSNWTVQGYGYDMRGMPTIANFYDDRQNGYATNLPEATICTSQKLTSFNLNFPSGIQWNLSTADISGETGVASYDLNGDGIDELIYRDERTLRIMNGNTSPPANYASRPSFSATAMEQATVADVDNDGQTNLVIVGTDVPFTDGVASTYAPGRLRVYKGSTTNAWTPSRSVWNQRGYCPVSISSNLQVPRVEQSRLVEIPSGQTPAMFGLNTYNVQSTENFLPPSYVSAPDLTGEITSFNCLTRSINFKISNLNGSTIAPTGISVTFYDGNPTTTNAPIVGRFVTTQAIAAGTTLNNLAAISSVTPTSGAIYMVVNDGGSLARPFNLATQFPVTNVLECSYMNNINPFVVNCSENCTDGLDNDGDGLIDCYDPNCCGNAACQDVYYSPCLSSTCTFSPSSSTFGMNVQWQTNLGDFAAFTEPVVGDLDLDGNNEVVARRYNASSNGIVIMDGLTGTIEAQFGSTQPDNFFGCLAIADIDKNDNGFAEIIYGHGDGTIQCFNHDGTLVWTSPRVIFANSFYSSPPMPSIADFNGDGFPEIYAGRFIINGQTGALMGTGNAGAGSVPSGVLRPVGVSVAVDAIPTAQCPACDGLELVAGNTVYAVTINRLANTATLTPITTAAGESDGLTSVADWNADGQLDGIISTIDGQSRPRVYVYNLRTGASIGAFVVNGLSTDVIGNTAIANLDTDNALEACFATYNRLITIDNNFTQKWSKNTVDISGATGCTVFDFNNDGSAEVCFRDETTFFVLNGNNGAVLNSIPSQSGTSYEYPVIVDVDKDNETEILVINGGVNGVNEGNLVVYKSSQQPWLPSRSVWNQHVYHYTNINDDLSVPTNMQQHQLPGNRTLNSFLSQYGRLDFPAVDLSVLVTTATCVSSNSASVTYIVTNTGIPTGGGMSVSFYNGNPNTAGSTRLLTINNLPALATGASVTFTQALTGLTAGSVIYVLVNDNGSDPVPVTFPITGIPECDYTNNTASVTLTPCNTCTFDAALSAVTVTCDRDSLILTTQICNTGTGPIPTNFGISCWLNNPVTLASATRLDFLQTNTAIAPNTCMPITFRIPRQLGNYTIVANDVIGSTPLLNLSNPPIPECDMTNNVVTGTFAGYPPPTLELGPNINVCENAIANITAQAGFATYRWQDGFDGRQYTATRSGIYALTVTDICGFTQADTVTVSFSNPIVLNLPDTIRVCQGTSRIISAPVGVPSYTYSWFPNIELAGVTAANATITPTANRTYQLIVTNVNGCLAVDSTHIEVQNCVEICNDGIDNNANGLIDCLDPFCAVALSLNDRDSACIGSSIQLNPITTANTIAWTGPNGFTSTLRAPILSNIQLLDGGIYRITITDSNGCSTNDSIDVEVFGTPIITATGGTFCEQSLASVSATGAISYSWTSSNNWFGSGQTVLLGPASNALAGVYSVTGTDANGCTASTSTTLQIHPAPSISVSVTTNISCFGVCDGLIALTPNPNNVGYVWSNGGRGAVQSGLCAGTYSVTVSNSIGCTASLSNIVLNQPSQITASITVVRPISCHGRCDAELMVIPSGSSGNYRILWDDGQFANTSTGRCFGPYSVTITDTNNCSTVITGNLPTPLPLNAVIQSDDARCHGEPSGVAEAQVIGGTLPYSFLWNNAQVRAVATGLAAGSYSVSITDANGCSLSMATNIQEHTSLSAFITGSFLDCFDGTDGTIQLDNISGGIPPYYAQWDDGTVGFIVTNRPIGSLGVVLSDANGCSLRLVGSVSAPTPLRIFADSVRMPTCHGYSDGFASVNPQGGVWPYRYRWGNGSTFAQIQLVPAGVYEVTVTDANGCTAQNTNILINQPSPLSLVLTPVPATLLCHGAENGSITPRVTGGTMPYSYYWDDGSRQSNRSGLPANRYTLLVKDANECAITDSVNITEPVPLNASVVVEQPLCFGESGGFEILVDSTTGRAPFRYAINDALFGNNALYQGMEEGAYRIRVKDANDCNFTDTISIEEPLEIQLQLPDTFYVSPPNRVRLSNTVINAIGQVSYWWSPSTGLDCATCPEPFSSVSQTTVYTLRITDANGCVAEANTIVLSENIPCLFVPNSFTPNDDGANDYFYPKSGECVSQVISLKIFDRWGELIFEQKNFEPNVPNLGWNGMFNGEPMDNGVYVWSMGVLFQNGKREIVNGDVTLLK